MGKFYKFLFFYLFFSSLFTIGFLIISARNISSLNSSLKNSLDNLTNKVDAAIAKSEQNAQAVFKINDLNPTPGSENLADEVLGATESAEQQAVSKGYITIKDKDNQNVNVYFDKKTSSKIVGQAVFNKAYRFFEEEGNWFLISLLSDDSLDKKGWVQAQLFKKIAEN